MAHTLREIMIEWKGGLGKQEDVKTQEISFGMEKDDFGRMFSVIGPEGCLGG